MLTLNRHYPGKTLETRVKDVMVLDSNCGELLLTRDALPDGVAPDGETT